jgi:hypothetical protein
MLILGLNKSLWLDEVYTIKLSVISFKHVILTTATDVHPPLYYLILKSILLILPKSLSFNNIYIYIYIN